MTALTISVSTGPEPEATELISAGLDEFNIEASGIKDRQPLAVLVRDPATEKVVGGLIGRTSLGLLFVDLFYLPAELRGHGVGGEVLQRAEQEARRRGCRTGMLYTISFQAPGFYEKHGWRRAGEVGCDPPGTSRVFLIKDPL